MEKILIAQVESLACYDRMGPGLGLAKVRLLEAARAGDAGKGFAVVANEIKELARDEIAALTRKKESIESEIKTLLLPKDPNDAKNVIVEIRAGTGGEEAALFAGDLFRMYSRYAENRSWKVEVATHHPTGVGGLKEVIAMIQGKGAYSVFKYESGTHRVQRVPETETQGRIHTSACTVAIMPEVDAVADVVARHPRRRGHGREDVLESGDEVGRRPRAHPPRRPTPPPPRHGIEPT